MNTCPMCPSIHVADWESLLIRISAAEWQRIAYTARARTSRYTGARYYSVLLSEDSGCPSHAASLSPNPCKPHPQVVEYISDQRRFTNDEEKPHTGRERKKSQDTRTAPDRQYRQHEGDIQELFKETIAEFMENALEAELDGELGYSKYDYKNKRTDNSRCGYSEKTLRTSSGDVELSVPRDRKSGFEPQLLKKNQNYVLCWNVVVCSSFVFKRNR